MYIYTYIYIYIYWLPRCLFRAVSHMKGCLLKCIVLVRPSTKLASRLSWCVRFSLAAVVAHPSSREADKQHWSPDFPIHRP